MESGGLAVIKPVQPLFAVEVPRAEEACKEPPSRPLATVPPLSEECRATLGSHLVDKLPVPLHEIDVSLAWAIGVETVVQGTADEWETTCDEDRGQPTPVGSSCGGVGSGPFTAVRSQFGSSLPPDINRGSVGGSRKYQIDDANEWVTSYTHEDRANAEKRALSYTHGQPPAHCNANDLNFRPYHSSNVVRLWG